MQISFNNMIEISSGVFKNQLFSVVNLPTWSFGLRWLTLLEKNNSYYACKQTECWEDDHPERGRSYSLSVVTDVAKGTKILILTSAKIFNKVVNRNFQANQAN